MLIIADQKIPQPALNKLSDFGALLLFETTGVTYEAISGHPDIFFCRVNGKLVVAPNLPISYKKELEKRKINFFQGELPVGKKYPDTAKYNVVCTEKYLFHNFRYTDSIITNLAENLDLIHLNQGYSRCNLLPLKNDHFITSDEGIFRVLKSYPFEVLFVNPENILLPGFKHGFFGGTAGVLNDKIFIIGNLNYLQDGNKKLFESFKLPDH